MAKILIAGDFCPQLRVANFIEKNDDSTVIFNEIQSIVKNADYSIVNLECPVVLGEEARPIKKIGPHLRCDEKTIKLIKSLGFEMITLANNHIYDYGEIGIKDTLEVCKNYGITTVGAGVNLEQAKKNVSHEIKGKCFSFINCCEHEFSIADDINGGANPLNIVSIYWQIQEAKKISDYIIIIVHGGHEHFQLPSPRMKETYRFFIDVGADVIINHHQHCYSGYEIYKGKPIFYGIGNFSFDKEKRRNSPWNEGYLVEINFTNDNISFQLYPFIQGNENPGVVLMDKEEKERFLNNIQQLNMVITDDKLLNNAIKNYYCKEGKNLVFTFEPYSNRYTKFLYRRNLLPSFINEKKSLLLRNIIECESHRDKIIGYLKNTH